MDPVAARLVAAALLGIGVESLLRLHEARLHHPMDENGNMHFQDSYKAKIDTCRGMLNLKIIWSFGALIGLAISLVQGEQGRPAVLWLLLIAFLFFHGLWVYWRVRISHL